MSIEPARSRRRYVVEQREDVLLLAVIEEGLDLRPADPGAFAEEYREFLAFLLHVGGVVLDEVQQQIDSVRVDVDSTVSEEAREPPLLLPLEHLPEYLGIAFRDNFSESVFQRGLVRHQDDHRVGGRRCQVSLQFVSFRLLEQLCLANYDQFPGGEERTVLDQRDNIGDRALEGVEFMFLGKLSERIGEFVPELFQKV